MNTAVTDLRHALGVLRRAPGATLVTVVTMAIAVGLTTAVFSLMYAVLLRPLPYQKPDRLVAIWQRHEKAATLAKVFDSYRDFTEWQKQSRSFSGLAAITWARAPQTMTGRGVARSVTAFPASIELFGLLGARPMLGRTFTADDLARGCTVVLAHRFWQNVLGSDPHIVGQSLTLDRAPCTIAGVMPPAFTFYPDAAEVWTLITPQSAFAQRPDDPQSQVGIIGRLAPGATPASAQAELTTLHRALHARVDPNRLAFVPLVSPLRDEFTWVAGRSLRASVIVLFGAVIALLLVACLNVAGVLVGRGIAREREFALRAALGSSRVRIARQVLTESALLASFGAASGLLVAFAAIRGMAALQPIELPPGTHLRLDWPVLAFTMLATAMTTILCGLWPAWRASRTDVNVILQSTSARGGSSGRWGFPVLVIAEVTLSVLVLTGAALLLQSIRHFASAPLGFNADGVVTQRVDLPADRADRFGTPELRWRFFESLIARAAAEPGIAAVAISSALPLNVGSSALTVDDRAATVDTLRYDVAEQAVSASYFRVLDVPLHRGRLFDDRDRLDSPPVAIINEALARAYFPGEDPIGKRIHLGAPENATRNAWLTVVGVIGTEQRASVFQELAWIGGSVVFRPISQSTPQHAVLLARAAGTDRANANADASGVMRALQRDIAALDPTVPVGEGHLLREELDKRLAYPRFRAALLGLFAAIALFLAALGLYGVLSHSVAQRRREIAIRVALGAQRANVLWLITRQGLRLAIAGTAIGVIAAWNSTQMLSTLLYGITPTDVPTLAMGTLIVMAVACLATYVPARRAARLDPLIALKQE